MANMSYCRFENTVSDMVDCLDALVDDDFDVKDLSTSEKQAMGEMYNILDHMKEYLEYELGKLQGC